MKLKYIFNIILALLAMVGIAWFISKINKPKIAYVRSQELVYGYDGTKEATAKFNTQKEQWQANIDTLKSNFENAVKNYESQYQTLSEEGRNNFESRLASQEQQLMTYSKAITDKIQNTDDESMQVVLNQINAFVEKYGKDNGYDVIMGTTLSGSVLYGDEKLDITEDLLKALNNNYNGE